MNFDNKPVLVFWELTKACGLSCIHCRAEAMTKPRGGELSTTEGFRLIKQVAGFGKPAPVLIMTGGDPLMRTDLEELVAYAHSEGVAVAISPAVSENLTREKLRTLKALGVSSISISLDSPSAEVHDRIRQVKGTYDKTLAAIKTAVDIGLNVQVNSTVMKQNERELPELFDLIKSLGVKTWEVFFLIVTGRGKEQYDISPEEYEAACNFLYDAVGYGTVIRSVEAPFIRRVALLRSRGEKPPDSELYKYMHDRLLGLCGNVTNQNSIGSKGTLDGDGIIFVSDVGDIYPGGFLPIKLGNVRKNDIVAVYRENELLKNIRNRKFDGSCGKCEFSVNCGGSRARAYAYSGNALGTDYACVYAETG